MHDVSVIILSHNAAPYIAAAIASALGQTHPPREILVIDDSTDDSPAVVARCQQQAPQVVKLLRVPPCNVSKARNLALEQATGDLIAFLDADDLWLPEKTARQLAALADAPDAVGASAPYFDFRTDLDDCQRRVPKPATPDPQVRDILFQQNLSSSTILVRRSAIGALRFDEQAPDGEDTIFVAELRLRGPWRCVSEPLIAKRLHGGQASSGHWHQVRNTQTRAQWVRRRRDPLGGTIAGQLDAELGQELFKFLEHRYWARQFDDLPAMLRDAQALFPESYQRSFLSRTRLYPRWVYRLRDWMR